MRFSLNGLLVRTAVTGPDLRYALVAVYRIHSYFAIPQANWRSWIAHNGPILTRLNVDATFADATNTKGVLKRYQPASTVGGHAVAIVGYTPTSYIVRNSWGADWGDVGFAHASESYAHDAFTEAYGVA